MTPAMSKGYHTPVLLKACIEYLNIIPDGTYVDLTFGGGGHSAEILKHLSAKGRLFAFDQDADAQANAIKDPRFTLIPQNFRYLKNYLRLQGVKSVDGILGDFGVSSHQFDEAERGFSIRFDAELDMRMNRANDLSAKKVVNEYSVDQLANMFREYAEVNNAGKLAHSIVNFRAEKEISTTGDLKEAISSCIPKFEENKFLARVFQALRIEVNQEIEVLKECLTQCLEVLNADGRLVMLSYHSLEDRLVKNLIKTGNVEGKEEKDVIYGTGTKYFKALSSKPMIADEEEVKENPRARSAKLRAAVKL
jgi:16S rRNA (cytosine1402-N4)-methyltransferase